MTHPCWRYRKVGEEVEAQLFENIDDVPKNEGWCDSPQNAMAGKGKTKPKTKPKPEPESASFLEPEPVETIVVDSEAETPDAPDAA